MSRATVVSIFPFVINEEKPGVYPGNYFLPACLDPKKPSILQINDGVTYLFDGVTGKSIKLVQVGEAIARSVVEDFKQAFIATGDGFGPGVFWVEGHHSQADVLKLFTKEIKEETERQEKWFLALTKMADDDYAKFGQHKSVSDLQRFAASYLKFDRPWARKIEEQAMQSCPACWATIPGLALVCSSCKTIVKPEEYKARFKQAESIGV